MNGRFPALDDRERLVLHAALGRGEDALRAWHDWYHGVTLDDVEYPVARVFPAVFANLQAQGLAGGLPPRLRGKYRWVWASNQLRATTVATALRSLSDAGATPMLLKGAALLAAGHVKWGAREMGDVDVLVDTRHAERAARALQEAGWVSRAGVTPEELATRVVPRRHSWNYEGPEHGDVDLHWHCFENVRGRVADDPVWHRAVPAELGGEACQRPDDADQLVHVIEHGANGEAAHRLLWLLDASVLVSLADPRLVASRAHTLGLHDTLVEGLELLSSAAGSSAITEIVRRVQGRGRGWRERALAMADATTERAPARRRVAETMRSLVVNGFGARHALGGLVATARRRIEPALRSRGPFRALPALTDRLRKVEVVRIRRLGPVARPPAPVKVLCGAWLDLDDATVRAAVAGPGWSWPQPDGGGVWADGADARLVLDVDAPPGTDVTIDVALGADAHASPNPHVTVLVNARPVTSWDLGPTPETCPRRIDVPAWLADWCRPIEVTFRPRRAFDPGNRLGASDSRLLVPIQAVRVTASPASTPSLTG